MTAWASVPLRRVFTVVNGGTPTSDADNWGGDIPWATPIDLASVNGYLLFATERTLSTQGLRSGSRAVPAGSLIVSTRAPVGYVVETTTYTAFNQGCRGLVPKQPVDMRYFRYQLLSLAERLAGESQGSTFVELSGETLGAFPVVLPPARTQRAIADLLDTETARIDALIVTLSRQTKLLRERRQALINAAVTGDLEVRGVAT